MKLTSVLAISSLVLVCAGCAPLEVAGTYMGSVTNGENACMLDNFPAGGVSNNIDVVVTQSGSAVTATVGGLTGAGLSLLFGSNAFNGSTTVAGFNAKITGTRSTNSGNCAYTGNAEIDASLSGNALSGTVTYTYQTNNGTDCGYRTTCRSVQQISFVRPAR